MLAAIFLDFEHLNDFQEIGYGGHFVFQNEARILHRHVFSPAKLVKISLEINESISKLRVYIPFNIQGHIGTGLQHCHLWDSNPER